MTLFFCILNIVIVINADKFIEMILTGELESESGEMYHAFDWKIVIIIISSLLIISSILSYLFNVNRYKNINKKVQTVVLYIDIVLVVLCVFLCLICICSIYSSLQLLMQSGSYTSYSELSMVKNIADMMNNWIFRDSLVILVISSICALVMPIISLYIKIADKDEKSIDNNVITNDINIEMKNEVEKLKKQLELEDLKQQYADLYKKLLDNEKIDNKGIDETRNY